jgi:hypothetical protein
MDASPVNIFAKRLLYVDEPVAIPSAKYMGSTASNDTRIYCGVGETDAWSVGLGSLSESRRKISWKWLFLRKCVVLP